VGYDKPRPGGKGFTGGAICAPIWARFMSNAMQDKPVMEFPLPGNVVTAVIDPKTGLLATPICPIKQEEFYVAGTEPKDYCPKHGG
jgi:membrane carboxypeptidase/penicillin-binding protein